MAGMVLRRGWECCEPAECVRQGTRLVALAGCVLAWGRSSTLPPMAMYHIDTHGELEGHISQEWLLSNGMGGFAMGTVVGCNTRRYHGLLVAATSPPVGRVMALNRIGEIVVVDGRTDQLLEFSINQFEERFHPRGDRYLRSFELDDTARWEWLWKNVDFDMTMFATVAGVKAQDASSLFFRLKGLRLIYPDGTINVLAKQYLQAQIMTKIRSATKTSREKPQPESAKS